MKRSEPRGSRLFFASANSHLVQTASLLAVLLVMVVGFGLTAEAFLTVSNLINLVRQLAPLLVVAVAMTFVVTTGGIDLSVGSVIALVGAGSAILLRDGLDPVVVLSAMAGLGIVIGLFQGYLVAYQQIPAFIVTLGGLTAFRGAALLITQGYSIPVDPSAWFLLLGQGRIWTVPVPVLLSLPIAFLGAVILNRTRFGTYVTGTGSNAEALRRFGVRTRLVILVVYMTSSLSAVLAGILITARLGSGSANAAVAFELEVIAAVVLGGTSLFGGRGTVTGTILGVLIIGIVANGLILLHVSPFVAPIVQGAVLLLAVFANSQLFNRFERSS